MGSKKKDQGSTSTTTLTAATRRSLPKPHSGFAVFAAPLLELYESNADRMHIDGIDAEATLATVRAYQALATAEAAAELALRRIKDQRLEQSSKVWSTMLEIYAHAQVIARTDPAMKEAIADFERFLKQRRAPKPVATPTAQH